MIIPRTNVMDIPHHKAWTPWSVQKNRCLCGYVSVVCACSVNAAISCRRSSGDIVFVYCRCPETHIVGVTNQERTVMTLEPYPIIGRLLTLSIFLRICSTGVRLKTNETAVRYAPSIVESSTSQSSFQSTSDSSEEKSSSTVLIGWVWLWLQIICTNP